MQTKTQSWIETIVGTAIGFIVAWVTMAIMYRVLDIPVRHAENTLMVTVMTVLSILRVYGVRRLFNWWHHRRQPSVEDVTRKLIESVAVATGLTYEELTRVPDYSKDDRVRLNETFGKLGSSASEMYTHMAAASQQLKALSRANTYHLEIGQKLEHFHSDGTCGWINTVDKQP